MTPREYLLARGWIVDERDEELAHELPNMRPWTDPVYGEEQSFEEALITQTNRDIERIGGYDSLAAFADASGRELEF
jgi:hypothetical protein